MSRSSIDFISLKVSNNAALLALLISLCKSIVLTSPLRLLKALMRMHLIFYQALARPILAKLVSTKELELAETLYFIEMIKLIRS